MTKGMYSYLSELKDNNRSRIILTDKTELIGNIIKVNTDSLVLEVDLSTDGDEYGINESKILIPFTSILFFPVIT